MSATPDIAVLIADSDPSVRAELRRFLVADGRFRQVTEVSAGDDAVRMASEVDVVIVDLRAVNGLGALGTISHIRRHRDPPPIVGLARPGDDWLGRAALHEGAVDVAEWPADGAAFVDLLIQAARRPADS